MVMVNMHVFQFVIRYIVNRFEKTVGADGGLVTPSGHFFLIIIVKWSLQWILNVIVAC